MCVWVYVCKCVCMCVCVYVCVCVCVSVLGLPFPPGAAPEVLGLRARDDFSSARETDGGERIQSSHEVKRKREDREKTLQREGRNRGWERSKERDECSVMDRDEKHNICVASSNKQRSIRAFGICPGSPKVMLMWRTNVRTDWGAGAGHLFPLKSVANVQAQPESTARAPCQTVTEPSSLVLEGQTNTRDTTVSLIPQLFWRAVVFFSAKKNYCFTHFTVNPVIKGF